MLMFAILGKNVCYFILLYINLHSGIGFFIILAKFGKIHNIFVSLPVDNIAIAMYQKTQYLNFRKTEAKTHNEM